MLDGASCRRRLATALDLVLREPQLTVVTRGGDRIGGRGPWRIGRDTRAASRAALDEARAQSVTASSARDAAADALVRGA